MGAQVRNGKGAIAPVLGPLLEELKSNFTLHHQSCLLYVASEVIKVGQGQPRLGSTSSYGTCLPLAALDQDRCDASPLHLALLAASSPVALPRASLLLPPCRCLGATPHVQHTSRA